MFGLGHKQAPPARDSSTSLRLRDSLFGDMPWDQWAGKSKEEPWLSFQRSWADHQAGANERAAAHLRTILLMPKLESRHYLQAWGFLRMLGQTPPPESEKHVYGIVIEVGMEDGLDLLAAYEDRSARYWNFSGAGVVWEPADNARINAAIAEVLGLAQTVIRQIGPWMQPRRAAPERGVVRLNILAPAGLHFGQAPMNSMMEDPVGNKLFAAGAHLMQALTETAMESRKATVNK